MSIDLARPTTDDVAAEIRVRTTDPFGNIVGSFTDLPPGTANATSPSAGQVSDTIDATGFSLELVLGDIDHIDSSIVFPPELVDAARRLWALSAALTVESSYFPEQLNSNQSPYDQLKQRFDDGMKLLASAVLEWRHGGAIGPADDEAESLMPTWCMGGEIDIGTGISRRYAGSGGYEIVLPDGTTQWAVTG